MFRDTELEMTMDYSMVCKLIDGGIVVIIIFINLSLFICYVIIFLCFSTGLYTIIVNESVNE